MTEHFKATVDLAGMRDTIEQPREKARRDAARHELDRLAAVAFGDVLELSQRCSNAMDYLEEHVRREGGDWTAGSTPAQRLAREALRHATHLAADAETLGYLRG
jgi:hypothetical protein